MILIVGIAVLAAGCSKPNNPSNGKEIPVEFTVSSRMDTRTAYAERPSGQAFQRIDWQDADRILIYGPNAVVPGTESKHYSVYKPVNIEEESARVSRAKVQNTGGERGLVWTEGDSPYYFYGMVPADQFTPVTAGDYSVVKATIPAAQTVGNDGTTGMENAFLLSAVTQPAYGQKFTMNFDPYFNAFEFVVGAEEGVTSLTINSMTMTSTSTALAGEFTLTGDPVNAKWTAAIPTTNAKEITVTVGETITPSSNATNPATIDVTFFAVPQALTDLTVTFNIDFTDGTGTHSGVTRKLTLNKNGAPIQFPACHKAYIKGLLLPSSVWQYTFNPTVDAWETIDPEDDDTNDFYI